jgi:threonine dehydratase
MKLPELQDILEAHQRIRGWVHRTPVLTCESINRISGCELYFKCENLQKVGAFKFRGASNAVLCLDTGQASRGVATHSSGNHAAALALAASRRNIPAYIVMPSTSPDIKKKAVAGYGAKITFCEPTLTARESTLDQVVKETGASFIHPYNNFQVVCGQGTASVELLEDQPDLDIIVTPVGGGGLLSGTATAVKGILPGIRVVAAEPLNANDAWQSFHSGKIVPSHNPKTIADGLLTSLGDLTFAIIRQKVDDILTVTEENIIIAMRTIWERMKIIVEPSAAVTLGIILEHPEYFRGKKVGLILSGGNVDLGKLPF